MLSYYIIPENVSYVQHIKEIESWTKTDRIDYNTPTVIVIEDSKATHFTKFVVVYKGLMQTQGGSGSCYNPVKPTYIHNLNPMDNCTMPVYMSKWCIYSSITILKMVIAAKYELLSKLGYRDKLPFWYWEMEGFDDNQGLLIGKLDLIGLGKADCSIITKKIHQSLVKALPC